MTIAPELLAAYKATDFNVFAEGEQITLNIGQPSMRFDSVLTSLEASCATVITAWNPWSRETSAAENDAAQTCLMESLAREGYGFIQAEGADPTGQWPPEPSLCVLGMNRQDAIRFGNQFKQNAVVYHEKGAATELLITAPD